MYSLIYGANGQDGTILKKVLRKTKTNIINIYRNHIEIESNSKAIRINSIEELTKFDK